MSQKTRYVRPASHLHMTLKFIRTIGAYEAPWVLLPTYSGFNTNPGVFLISAPLAQAD